MKAIVRACWLTAAALASLPVIAAETIEYPGLGPVTIESPAGKPRYFVLFLSGDGGWNKGVVDMARHLADEGALVAGVDIRKIAQRPAGTRAECINTAASLESLSHHVEQSRGLPEYLPPVLVGYSSGATLAYATLAQAPPGTFKGALSLGFCPDLEWSLPLCRGEGLGHAPAKKGFVYQPATHLQDPWIALQGEQDQVCAAPQTREFVGQVPGAKLVSLPAVGHGYAVERNWLPQFKQAFHEIADPPPATATPSTEVGDLPLVEAPASRASQDTFAIMLSGDGGWAGLDKAVAAEINARGLSVVGWDSLRYFWNARTPEECAHDLARVIEHYAHAWKKSRVLLVGYSQGADVLPFMVNRLPDATRARIAGSALIAVSPEAFFKFSVSHWITTPTGGLPVVPEVDRGRMGRFVCIFGAEDKESACRKFGSNQMQRVELPGGHHFDGDYAGVAAAVLTGLPK
ncbi:MAG TPA: AcvB/VirJ family lysyl-phosphatidylglycerol hydrolase [Steroidobacteraceae bacterium]